MFLPFSTMFVVRRGALRARRKARRKLYRRREHGKSGITLPAKADLPFSPRPNSEARVIRVFRRRASEKRGSGRGIAYGNSLHAAAIQILRQALRLGSLEDLMEGFHACFLGLDDPRSGNACLK